MLLLFIVPLLSVFVSANPFHKYPYVFLLDIGNEELDKTNREQIRLSIPGGSLAVRYPAIGNGDRIAHVRVSGIDFGNDLKAAIYDGGPGYKYVVLVFQGNAGVPYDAVVTLQTIPDDVNGQGVLKDGDENSVTDSASLNDNSYHKADEDRNDSSEDTNDISEIQYGRKSNEELVQSSSNKYDYAINEQSNTHENCHKNPGGNSQNTEMKEYIQDSDDDLKDEDISDDENEIENDYETEKSDTNNIYGKATQDEEGEDVVVVDSNLYDKYQALQPHLYGNVKVYPQGSVHDPQDAAGQSGYEDDPIEMDQTFNDEEIHNNADKYKDSNNNYYDTDDTSAVAS